MRQKVLLNLGRAFPIAKDDWQLLCQRVTELLEGQATLGFMTLPTAIETWARRIAKRLLERRQQTPEPSDWETVNVRSASDSDVRSVGVEHAALAALKLLDIPNKLRTLGLNKRQVGCALVNIIGHMAAQGSERETNAW
ncbi:MAG: hypothetical protein OXC63_09460 [Aestuariivita sp.]|nr:hypothetical protein [Aestuariivita sp.]MCY4345866.1 hypothetical protein [Aestuariivita sp.]